MCIMQSCKILFSRGFLNQPKFQSSFQVKNKPLFVWRVLYHLYFQLFINFQKKQKYISMQGSETHYLMRKSIVKHDNQLMVSKQSWKRKNSPNIMPIILNKPISNGNSLGSSQLKSKTISISKKLKLKAQNNENKVIQTEANFFYPSEQQNSYNQKNFSQHNHQRKERVSLINFQSLDRGNKRLTLSGNSKQDHNKLQLNKKSYKILEQSSNMLNCSKEKLLGNSDLKEMIIESEFYKNNQNQQFKSFKLIDISDIKESTKKLRLCHFSNNLQYSVQIKKCCNNQLSNEDSGNLSLVSNLMKFDYHPHFKLDRSKKNITIQEKNQPFYLISIKQSVKEHAKILDQLRKEQFQLQENITNKQKSLESLYLRLTQLKAQVNKVNMQYQQIINFSTNQERNRILKLVSQEYHQIQSQIYEYAAYLQSNKLAHDLSFEPRPFSQIESLILQREKQLKKHILQNEKETAKNSKMMSQYISQTMRLFKKKDVEMLNLNTFRTKCVNQFINKMKRWLNNWELKKEYLVNLKKEFLSTIQSLKKSVFLLEEEICAKALSLSKMEKIANAKQLIDKIELNFKLGNSFY